MTERTSKRWWKRPVTLVAGGVLLLVLLLAGAEIWIGIKIRRTIDETLGHLPAVQLPINIFLTNTLTPPMSNLERGEQLTLFDFSAAITEEAYNADTWKARRPIKVIIGNPPYLAASTNPYDISAYKTETDGVTDFGEKKHWLNDDYVKFFRFSEQIIDKNNEGVVSNISIFAGMRSTFRDHRDASPHPSSLSLIHISDKAG